MSDTTPLLPFAPVFSPEKYQEAAKIASQWNPTYLLALLVLTMDSATLTAKIQNDEGADAMMDLFETITEFQKWRKLDDEMIEAAAARLLVVMSEKAGLNEEQAHV